jgi:C_GCAxxG_C_C family probable redox protein
MTKVEEAKECFSGNCNCCQSIILTDGPQYGLEKDVGICLGTGFAGGISRHGDVCGAVSGSVMVIGLANGMTSENDRLANGMTSENDLKGRERTYELVNEFIKRFKEKNEYINCRELLDCNLSTPEGLKQAREKGLFSTQCPKFVQNAAEILEEFL